MEESSLAKVENTFKEILNRKYQEKYAEQGIVLLEQYKRAKKEYENLKKFVDRLDTEEDFKIVLDDFSKEYCQYNNLGGIQSLSQGSLLSPYKDSLNKYA